MVYYIESPIRIRGFPILRIPISCAGRRRAAAELEQLRPRAAAPHQCSAEGAARRGRCATSQLRRGTDMKLNDISYKFPRKAQISKNLQKSQFANVFRSAKSTKIQPIEQNLIKIHQKTKKLKSNLFNLFPCGSPILPCLFIFRNPGSKAVFSQKCLFGIRRLILIRYDIKMTCL